MMDRRSFLAALLGTAAAPKDVLAGIVTPAPVKKAVQYAFAWVPIAGWVNGKALTPEELKKLPNLGEGDKMGLEFNFNISQIEALSGRIGPITEQGHCVFYVAGSVEVPAKG